LRLLSGLRSETRSCVHAASSASTRLWSIVPSLLWASLIQDWRLEVQCGQTLDLLQPLGNKGNLVQGHGAADPHLPSLSLVWSLDHPAYNKQCQCSSAATRGHCPSVFYKWGCKRREDFEEFKFQIKRWSPNIFNDPIICKDIICDVSL
jgi:hypothetical protein